LAAQGFLPTCVARSSARQWAGEAAVERAHTENAGSQCGGANSDLGLKPQSCAQPRTRLCRQKRRNSKRRL
jgi:hypothetical protein